MAKRKSDGEAPRDEAPAVRKGRNHRPERASLRIPAAALDAAPAEPLAPAEPRRLGKKDYEAELRRLQRRARRSSQEWVKDEGLKVVVLFEGRDAAGQGRRDQADHRALNPRVARVVALPAPTEREKTQWYFQRYVAHLPAAGEIVLFDRSWYNRAGVERVMGFCDEEEYQEFLRSCPEFERMLVRSGDHPRQVLVQRQRRGAGAPLPGPHRRPDQALEALPDGPRVADALGRVLAGQGRDVRPHGHQAGAVVRGPLRRQEAGPAQRASATCSR